MARVPYDPWANEGPAPGATTPAPTRVGGRTVYDPWATEGPAVTSTDRKKKKKKKGFLDQLLDIGGDVAQLPVNLATDIGDVIVGAVPGAIHAGKALVSDDASLLDLVRGEESPFDERDSRFYRDVVKPTVQQYKEYYAGGNLLQNLYEHPLQPILDAATIATGGAAGTAKLGAGLAKAGRIAPESRLAQLGERGTITTRSPRQIATGEGPAQVELTSARPLMKLREQAIAGARTRQPLRIPGTDKTLSLGSEAKQYGKGIRERTSQTALSRITQYHDVYQRATRRLRPDERTALHIRAGGVHPDDLRELWERPGAERPNLGDLTPKAIDYALNPSPRMLKAEPVMKWFGEQGLESLGTKLGLEPESALERPQLIRRQVEESLGRPAREIPGGPEPYYFPHTQVAQTSKVSSSPLGMVGGGRGEPRPLGTMKRNEASLLQAGKLLLNQDVMGPEFLKRTKILKFQDNWDALRAAGVEKTADEIRAMPGARIPNGWTYIRENPSKIPPTLREPHDAPRPVSELLPEGPSDLRRSPLAEEGFTTDDAAQALGHAEQKYVLVPEKLAKAATGEFRKMGTVEQMFVSKPLKLWRDLVLGTRPAYLVNNVIGNALMYAIQAGGTGAMRDLYASIREHHGNNVAKQIADDGATPAELRRSFYEEHFPEQGMRGTIATQSPVGTPLEAATGRVGRAWETGLGALPRASGHVEAGFRRARARNIIRRSPEFKALVKRMPKEARRFDAVADRLMKGEGGPAFQRRVSKEIDDTFGSYRGLSHGEQAYMRNLLPFYAWYKSILRATTHLALDTPGRALLLAELGELGEEAQAQEVPSFLRGAVPIGEGREGTERVLTTAGVNPWMTLPQVTRGLTGDIGALGLNPFVYGALSAFGTEAVKQHRFRPQVAPGTIAAETGREIVRNLPPARLAFPQEPSELYPTRDRLLTALQQLGLPVREYDPREARRQKREGR